MDEVTKRKKNRYLDELLETKGAALKDPVAKSVFERLDGLKTVAETAHEEIEQLQQQLGQAKHRFQKARVDAQALADFLWDLKPSDVVVVDPAEEDHRGSRLAASSSEKPTP